MNTNKNKGKMNVSSALMRSAFATKTSLLLFLVLHRDTRYKSAKRHEMEVSSGMQIVKREIKAVRGLTMT